MTLLEMIFHLSFLRLSNDAWHIVFWLMVVLWRGEGAWVNGIELAEIPAVPYQLFDSG